MISEEWDELLRQQDEETTFADKYAEELEMMDEMETDPPPEMLSSRKSLNQLKCYAEDVKDAIDESPLPPIPPNSLCDNDNSYVGSSFTNGGHQEGTPQRRVFCAPKSMGGKMGSLPCEQENGRTRCPKSNQVTTIAGLLQSHAAAMETNSTEPQDQEQIDCLPEVCDNTPPAVSQPVKRTSSEDVNTNSASIVDEISSRPFKRRRKLITTNSPQERGDEESQETIAVKENSTIVKEGNTEQVTTPINQSQSQIKEDAGSVKKKPFFTSTPNDATYNDDIDSSIDADTVVTPTVYHYKRRRVLKRAPAGAHVTVTGSDGTRVYLRLSKEPNKQDKQEQPKRYQLLSVPFYQLRHEVESKKRRKLLEKSREAVSSLKSFSNNENTEPSDEPDQVIVEKETKRQLWVDQYSPHHFTELLSDDGTNRTLLAWLKLWDGVVFGRSVVREAVKKKKEEEAMKAGKKTWVEYKDPETFSTVDALDATNRPKLKFALLCGPPGLGKTTMAHVIARHAGYNVVEMNASDDRSPEVFQRSIEAATQMQALSIVDSRPNCLIIDEIDGAPTAAINVLLNVIKNKTLQGKKGQKKRPQILSRPIICICNDQYATSLRQLRQNSLVLAFPPTSHSRLASRLIEICRREQLQTSISALMALCEKTDADIRSCLNTLQFIHQNYKELSVTTINKTTIGQKDAQKSLFSLWKQVFHLPSSKSKKLISHVPKKHTPKDIGEEDYPTDPINSNAEATRSLSTNAIRFHTILSAAQTTGEDEKATQGLFENYLDIKFKDPNLEAVSVAQDWIEFKDVLQRHVNINQDYSVAPYHHFLPVAYHFLFAAPSQPKIRYPHKHFEARQAMQKNCQMIDSVLADVPPKVKCYLNSRTAVTELLPPLLEIISPNLRPVNTQLYSSKEKNQLSDLVNTMIACNLTYKQEKVPDGQYVYTLEPNVDEVVRFSGQAQRRQLTYATKQLIGREIEMEKVRRAEASVYKSDSKEASTPARDSSVSNQKKTPTAVKRPTQIEPKPLPVKRNEPAPARDFFGRLIKPKTSSGSDGTTHSQKKIGHILWFKYNEGYSNAVRRPIKMKDLL